MCRGGARSAGWRLLTLPRSGHTGRALLRLALARLEPAGVPVVGHLVLRAHPGEELAASPLLAQQLAPVRAGDPCHQGRLQAAAVVLQAPLETGGQACLTNLSEVKSTVGSEDITL